MNRGDDRTMTSTGWLVLPNIAIEAEPLSCSLPRANIPLSDSDGGIDVGAPATKTTNANLCDANGNWQSTGKETCNYTGLTSAFKTVQNLVNIGGATDAYNVLAGAARSITPGYANGTMPVYAAGAAGSPLSTYRGPVFSVVPYLNSSTVPQARINALANVLASCVEETAAQCSSLFSAAMPSRP